MAIFWFGFCLPAQAVTFTVSFDRNPITLGESAVLSLTFEGGASTALPAIPQIPNLQFSDPPGYTTRTLIENGVVSSS
ncbi:MAG TPA: hypothetical protein VN048_06650, partial [Verrucomicrobiae bacterium]|nr:hypothetical protein [Verrucomicrobiae bacterium]